MKTMDRASRFIQLYNELSEYLRKLTGLEKSATFSEIVNAASKKSTVVRRVANTLRDYADLRNAIVHHRTYPSEIIAEPKEETVSRFGRLHEEIVSPPRVIPKFQREVRLFTPSDRLIEALRYMKVKDFSQVVVQEDGQVSLLTVEAIARWLEERAEKDLIDASEATIADAHTYESPSHVSFLSRQGSVYDAIEVFASMIEQGRPRLYAIIVSQNGKQTEMPLGIITPWDLLGLDGSNR